MYAIADALVRPDYKERGLRDTALVNLRFDSGAMATAEANFHAVYGYDVRGEVFGSGGMLTMGDVRRSNMTRFAADGVCNATTRLNTDLFQDGYTAQLGAFVDAVRSGVVSGPGGEDARAALAITLACVHSVSEGRPVRMAEIFESPPVLEPYGVV